MKIWLDDGDAPFFGAKVEIPKQRGLDCTEIRNIDMFGSLLSSFPETVLFCVQCSNMRCSAFRKWRDLLSRVDDNLHISQKASRPWPLR